MRVSVIGAGYVGLVSGACLAEKGHQVICVDVDAEKVAQINRAEPPIYERGLPELLARHVGRRLRATTDLCGAVLASDLSLIAVGTPFDGQAIDLSSVRAAAEQIGVVLRDKPGYHVVVVKSTVVPGTTDELVRPTLEASSGKQAGPDFGVGVNPEFLREGEAVADFLQPDRIVLGGIDECTLASLRQLYRVFPDVPQIITSTRTAEMIKYAANSLLATMISFANEIGNLCASAGEVDVVDVMQAVHLDRRLSPVLANGERVVPALTAYLEAGCGFGGSCFPKDVKALVAYGRALGRPMPLLDAVMQVNERQPSEVLALLTEQLATMAGVRIAVLGLAFKAGTNDMRESPAVPVVQGLLARGAEVVAFDPIARREAELVFGDAPNLRFCDDLGQAVDGADAVVLLSRDEALTRLPDLLARRDQPPVVIDGRRLLRRDSVARYSGIGLGGGAQASPLNA